MSRNLNMSVVKNVTDVSIKRVEFFIVSKDDPKARVPTKNFEEIVPNELSVDKYTTLVLQGGTNEISNLDVSGDVGTKIEAMKNEVKVSTSKLYSIAEKSLEENPTLEQVIILKRIFRCDPKNRDPLGMKSQLSEYGNNLLDELWMTRGCPQNIKIEKQALECDGELRVARFGLPSANGYDGTHFRGEMAVQHYTASMLNVLLDVFSVNPSDKINLQPNPNTNRNPPQYARTPLGQNVPPMHKSKLRNPAQTQRSNYHNYNGANYNSNNQQTYYGNSVRHTQSAANHWTGMNNAWMGGNQGSNYFYNVDTQNRFNISGN